MLPVMSSPHHSRIAGSKLAVFTQDRVPPQVCQRLSDHVKRRRMFLDQTEISPSLMSAS